MEGIRTFAEPCLGEGKLAATLMDAGFKCVHVGDIQTGQDALTDPRLDILDVDAIITNPPWSRHLLHPMIWRFIEIAPTWLLFDAAWAHTAQARPFLPFCSHIVSVGRVRWIDGTKWGGKDDAAWYRFEMAAVGPPKFYNPA